MIFPISSNIKTGPLIHHKRFRGAAITATYFRRQRRSANRPQPPHIVPQSRIHFPIRYTSACDICKRSSKASMRATKSPKNAIAGQKVDPNRSQTAASDISAKNAPENHSPRKHACINGTNAQENHNGYETIRNAKRTKAGAPILRKGLSARLRREFTRGGRQSEMSRMRFI